jgi:hypothetical protein
MNAIEQALYEKLISDPTLIGMLGGTAIYNTLAPIDQELPFVVFSLSSGREDNLTPLRSVREIYLVKAVARTLYEAGQIADRIDYDLHGTTLNVDGWHHFWLARETIVRYEEITAGGRTIGHAGGEYAVHVSK